MMMLVWSQPIPDQPNFDANLETADPAAIKAAVGEAWTKLLDEIDSRGLADWEIVLAYLVVESGEILLYPSTRTEPNRGIDALSIQISVEDWSQQYAEMTDQHHEGVDPDEPTASPSPVADARFTRQYRALLKQMARTVKDSLTDPALAPRMATLKKRAGFAVYYVDQGENLHTVSLVYLWGQRPPGRFPSSTPRELFTGLLHRAELTDQSLKCDGDQVIEATFFGNDFDLSYVKILESIPNVAQLCGRLRVLHLHHTKIGPTGVERLQALFPKVKIKVKP